MISNNEFDEWGQKPAVEDNPDGPATGVDLMQVAMRRKGLIALGVFVGLCLGLLYYARATPVYESTALLSIEEKAPPMATSGRLEQAFVMTTPAEDHAIRIKTPRIINDALDMNGNKLRDLPSLAVAENPIQDIYDGLTVEPVQDGSEVLALSFRGSNPDDCQQILDHIIISYRDFLNIGRENVGKDMKTWIRDARDNLQTELEIKTKQHEDWKQNSNLFLLSDEGTNIHQLRQTQLEQLRFEEQANLDELAIQIEIINDGVKQKKDPRALLLLAKTGFSVLDSGDRLIEIEQIRAEIQKEVRSEQRAIPFYFEDIDLARRFGKDHPRRIALKRQIELADRAYREDSANVDGLNVGDQVRRAAEKLQQYALSLNDQYRAAEKRLSRLAKDFENERKMAEAIARDAATHRSMQDDIARTQKMFDAVVEKFADVDLLEKYGGDDKLITETLQDPGPGLRVAPSLAKSLAAGTMLGFLAGFGLGYLVEMFDKTFRSPQEVSTVLQLPMIGHIPEITTEALEGSALSETLVTFHKPKSPFAENFRAIRTALYFSSTGQQTRVIQTTSPVPGDGKSTLTANIAITIAQSNKSVLLIDADFRRPTQHKLFGVTNEHGLSSVVAGEVDPDQAAQITEVPNLYLMSCGPRPHNPSELLTSPQFADLIEVLREQYDFVVIDTPPVLAVTDPGIVSARVDGVIMCLRIRKNGRPSAVRARKILHDLHANMLGIVVNGIDHRSGSYGYYSSYRKGYGYNYSYKYGYGQGQDRAEQAISKYFEEPGADTPHLEQVEQGGGLDS